VSPSPIARPSDWLDVVNQRLPLTTRDRLRDSARREIPFGDPEWIRQVENEYEEATSDHVIRIA
jgi:hypothetical protein